MPQSSDREMTNDQYPRTREWPIPNVQPTLEIDGKSYGTGSVGGSVKILN